MLFLWIMSKSSLPGVLFDRLWIAIIAAFAIFGIVLGAFKVARLITSLFSTTPPIVPQSLPANK